MFSLLWAVVLFAVCSVYIQLEFANIYKYRLEGKLVRQSHRQLVSWSAKVVGKILHSAKRG